jgi:uncharacterized protein
MTERQEKLKEALTKLMGQAGITGAAVVSRDGICVSQVTKRPIHQEVFGAMTAMVMGAAEAAMEELGQDGLKGVSIESPKARLQMAGITDEFLLVVVAGAESKAGELSGKLSQALTTLAELVR